MNAGASRSSAFDGALVGDAVVVDASPIVMEPAPYQSRLPAMTFSHLRTLSRAGTRPGATIRQIHGGYVVEFDIGPTRWILISTHSKRPRRFQHVDGAVRAIRPIGAHPIRLTLLSDDNRATSECSPPERN